MLVCIPALIRAKLKASVKQSLLGPKPRLKYRILHYRISVYRHILTLCKVHMSVFGEIELRLFVGNSHFPRSHFEPPSSWNQYQIEKPAAARIDKPAAR
jgi:hypothetical protein